jgi:hypothetical protein
MFNNIRRIVLVAVAVLLVGAVCVQPAAAYPPSMAPRIARSTGGLGFPYSAGVNPYYQIWPGMTINQYAYNTALLGRAYSNVPPYALGYNPYPSPVYMYGAYPYYSPYGYGAYPYAYGSSYWLYP